MQVYVFAGGDGARFKNFSFLNSHFPPPPPTSFFVFPVQVRSARAGRFFAIFSIFARALFGFTSTFYPIFRFFHAHFFLTGTFLLVIYKFKMLHFYKIGMQFFKLLYTCNDVIFSFFCLYIMCNNLESKKSATFFFK